MVQVRNIHGEITSDTPACTCMVKDKYRADPDNTLRSCPTHDVSDQQHEETKEQARERTNLLKFKHGYFRLKQENEDLREQVNKKNMQLDRFVDAIDYYTMLTDELRSALESGDEGEKKRLLGEAVLI